MIALSVNLNKIALIRNSREGNFPDVLEFARLCIAAGADGITVHPRPDQRHIRAEDCRALAKMLSVEFNIEGNPFAGPLASSRADVGDYPGLMPLLRELRPAQATLVPDGDNQLTSDHGFDLTRQGEALAPVVNELKALGIRVSLFMDPVPEQIRLAAQLGVDRIELYTGPYAAACARPGADCAVHVAPYREAALLARELGLGVNAGHDLNLQNLPAFAKIPQLEEVSIGHALTVDALHRGMTAAVQAYQRALGKPA
ncbi:MAG TPA: pyridoxine 5'-phosphate synthase [Spongiibacteraceae bacterium]|nr:pyridoxine 5'-phosphate synthase [Spongiibacteraceae bacterium]